MAPDSHFGDVEMIAVVPPALPVAADERGEFAVDEQRRPFEAGCGLEIAQSAGRGIDRPLVVPRLGVERLDEYLHCGREQFRTPTNDSLGHVAIFAVRIRLGPGIRARIPRHRLGERVPGTRGGSTSTGGSAGPRAPAVDGAGSGLYQAMAAGNTGSYAGSATRRTQMITLGVRYAAHR